MRNLTDALMTPAAAAPVAPPPTDNSFTQGMRQNVTAAGGQLHGLAGGIGEALGANDFAKAQYAKAAEAEQLAATQAPEISQWQQVRDAPDLSTGIRRAGSYVAGLAGGAVPMMGLGLTAAGVTAATGGGALPALAAGTAAMAPFETGGALQQQQHDPAALANNSAGMRLGTAMLQGTARAGLMNAVPTMMGGQLLGRGLANTSLADAIKLGALEGVGGNALAGAGAEKVSTMAENYLNPNRDSSDDHARMVDAAVSGATLGVPFAGMGVAGHILHGAIPRTDGIPLDRPATKPVDAAPGAVLDPATPPKGEPVPAPSMMDRAKGLFAKGDDAAEKIASGGDIIDVEALKNAPPEQQSTMLREDEAKREATTRSWTYELLSGDALSPENRAKVAAAAQDLSSRANQSIVAGVKVATDAGSKALNAATEFYKAISIKRQERTDGPIPLEDGKTIEGVTRWADAPAKSEISAGADKAIGDVVAPHIAARYPDLMNNDAGRKAVTGTLRVAMDTMQKTGKLDPDMAEHLHGWFGNDTPSVLADLHDKVMGDNQHASENYFAAVNKMTDDMGNTSKLADKVRAALVPELQDSATPEDISGAVKVLRDVASGAHTDGMTPERAKFENQRINDTLQQHFGDKTESILKVFAKENDKRLAEQAAAPDNGVTRSDSGDGFTKALEEGGFADTPDAGVTKETDKLYYGGGNDKANPSFVLSERAHNAQYGGDGQASRLLRETRTAHPDMNVSTVPAEIYARDHGWGKQQLMDATNGKPQDHVMIKAEGIKRDGLSWQDVEAMKNDSHNYPDSPSKIPTTAGITLDAMKVMNHYAQEHMLPRNETDALSPMHRMARQFKEGIGAVSDHLGEAVHVPDDTVVARRAGRAITWGEMQKASRIPEADPASAALYNERVAAVKAGDKEAVAKIDTKLDAQVIHSNDPNNDLPDGAPKTVAVNNDRADRAARDAVAATAKNLGAARKAVETEMAKNGPLRDNSGNVARPLTMKERTLVKEHDKLVKEYMRKEQQVGRDRPSEFDAAKEALLMGEAPLDRNVHWGAKEYGDALGARFKASEMQDAQGNPLHADNFKEPTHFDGRLTRDTISAVENRVQQFEIGKSAAARAVGEKGRALVELVKSGQMKQQDAALLASIIKDKSGASRAAQINELAAKYKDVVAQPKKPSAFVERVLAGGQDFDKTIKQIKTSDDVPGLQRAVDALAPHVGDMRADTVLEHANERIAHLIEKDPSTTYNMQRTSATSMADAMMRGDIRAHIDKVLGKTVDVEFAKMLHAGEFVRDPSRVPQGMAQDLIRISTHSLDPMGTAYHESLHALFAKLKDNNLLDKAAPLFKAADGEHVRAQLKELLKSEPDALKQIDASSEERAAYMYQFWEQGKLNLFGKPKSAIEKMGAFLRKVLGMWTNDQRAEHIMEYFGSGEYAKNMGDRNAVSRALERGSSPKVEWAHRARALKTMVGPLDTLAQRIVLTGDAQVRSLKNAALTEMLDKVYSPMQGEHGDAGYMPAARAKRTQVMNDLSKDLADYEPAVITDALRAMQRGEKGTTPAERQVVLRVHKTLAGMREYMTGKSVNMGDLGPDYFPRQWDTQKVRENEPAFRAMMQPYIDAGKFNGNVDRLIASLTRADGSELQVESIKPGMQFARERVLSFIRGEDAQPFLNDSLYQTLDSYVTQGTRRAEWAHRFGDDGGKLKAMFEDARKQGATDAHIALAQRYLKGIDGTLGDSIDPTLRRAFGNAIVYQNLRILPMMIFSSLPDAGGVLVRGGTIGEAFNTFKRGFAEIPEGFKKASNRKDDEATKFAETMGTIDSAVLMHTLGTSYSQGMTSDLGRKVNDTLFKYNLAEQYNRSMRVGATQAAVGFLGRHADGTGSPHSARWMAELGYKPGELKTGPDGRPLTSLAQFKAAGMSDDKAQAAFDKLTMAVNKWVDGAILRPNAAHKPLWMSDPHFAVVAHLKQFVYSFQENILKRAVNEARYGNFGPAYTLAAYVPFMLAVDATKGALLNGGSQPASRQNWDAADWLSYETQRAGLYGVGQFALDAAKDIHRGGIGIGALTGPTIEQLGEAASTIGGPEQFKTFAMNSMPANQLFSAAESAATNASD